MKIDKAGKDNQLLNLEIDYILTVITISFNRPCSAAPFAKLHSLLGRLSPDRDS